MTSKQSWGRKETVIWPPHVPIYALTAVGVSLVATLIFVWQVFAFADTPLRKSYTTDYAKASVGAMFGQHGNYRLVYVAGGKAAPRPALPADFVPGDTRLPDGTVSHLALSNRARHEGRTVFYRGAMMKYDDAALSRWLGAAFFEGKSLLGTYATALGEGGLLLFLGLVFASPADVKRFREMKYGRRLKGPVLVTPAKFNKALLADGLAIETYEKPSRFRKPSMLRIPREVEPQHIMIMGDTGAGKSTLLKQLLRQIEDRGEVAIVYDPAGEFTKCFYHKDRGDWVLNPLDARTPYWTPSSELRNPAEARTIAASMYQPRDDKRGEFFTDTPQKIFAHLLKYKPSPEELVQWMSNEREIDRRLAGTELANFAPQNAPQQRAGVLASLGLVVDSLRLLPSRAEAKGREWSATDWAVKREGWIFLTSTEAEQEALRPLHSLWIDLLVLRLLTEPKPGQKKVWFVIDEMASLQRLPQFHNALTKGRKSDNPIVFCLQGKAQLETIWGHLAETMLSQPTTKFVLRTAEPNAAKWAAELLGEVEIERVRETVSSGLRRGKSFTMDRQIEPLVMKSEVEGLPNLHTYVKINNYVSRFAFPIVQYPKIAEALEPRHIPENKMWFDPLKEEEPAAPASTTAAAPPTSTPATPAAVSAPAPASKEPPELASVPAEAVTVRDVLPTTPPIAQRAEAPSALPKDEPKVPIVIPMPQREVSTAPKRII